MGRSVKDLRRRLAPLTGIVPGAGDDSLLRAAVPIDAPQPIAQTVKLREKQLRAGYPRKL